MWNILSHTKCFLHPITWKEPFGLTLIEAMACGCPVVAFNKGDQIPEIIKNGQTRFLVPDLESMLDAVEHIVKNGIWKNTKKMCCQ